VISIVYGAIMAIGTKDIMRLIAFTSISHFGFIVLGIFAFTSQSMVGSTIYMLNHGLSTAALFLVTGFLISRRGSRRVADYGGVQKVAPLLAGLMLFAGLSMMALPGLSTFVSEFMVVAGTFTRHPVYGSIAVFGIVLAALYVLLMYQRTATGPLKPEVEATVTADLDGRERVALAPLVLLIIVLGFFPRPLTAIIGPAVTDVMTHVGVTDPQPLTSAEGDR
jgi:NADH-quinone oxidoreductase subunit M